MKITVEIDTNELPECFRNADNILDFFYEFLVQESEGIQQALPVALTALEPVYFEKYGEDAGKVHLRQHQKNADDDVIFAKIIFEKVNIEV